MFHFCPFCGVKYPSSTEQFHQHCPSCNKSFFQNQNTTVCGVIIFEQKLLLTKRGRNPHKGLWDVPGGFVEPLEHPEAAVVREIREELGIESEVEKLITILAPQPYEFQGTTAYNCDHLYLLSVDSLVGISPQDDVEDFKLFTRDELPALEDCAFKCTPWLVKKFGSGKLK